MGRYHFDLQKTKACSGEVSDLNTNLNNMISNVTKYICQSTLDKVKEWKHF